MKTRLFSSCTVLQIDSEEKDPQSHEEKHARTLKTPIFKRNISSCRAHRREFLARVTAFLVLRCNAFAESRSQLIHTRTIRILRARFNSSTLSKSPSASLRIYRADVHARDRPIDRSMNRGRDTCRDSLTLSLSLCPLASRAIDRPI